MQTRCTKPWTQPNMYAIFKVLLTMPVSSASAIKVIQFSEKTEIVPTKHNNPKALDWPGPVVYPQKHIR